MEKLISYVASYLNEYMHCQAKHLFVFYQNQPQRYKTFNVNSYIQIVDPILMTLILLTQSVCSKWRRLFENEAEVSATKQTWHIFYCPHFFCVQMQCSIPFHTLVTEAIVCNGGTQEL